MRLGRVDLAEEEPSLRATLFGVDVPEKRGKLLIFMGEKKNFSFTVLTWAPGTWSGGSLWCRPPAPAAAA